MRELPLEEHQLVGRSEATGRPLVRCGNNPARFDVWLVDFEWRCTECGCNLDELVRVQP